MLAQSDFLAWPPQMVSLPATQDPSKTSPGQCGCQIVDADGSPTATITVNTGNGVTDTKFANCRPRKITLRLPLPGSVQMIGSLMTCMTFPGGEEGCKRGLYKRFIEVRVSPTKVHRWGQEGGVMGGALFSAHVHRGSPSKEVFFVFAVGDSSGFIGAVLMVPARDSARPKRRIPAKRWWAQGVSESTHTRAQTNKRVQRVFGR